MLSEEKIVHESVIITNDNTEVGNEIPHELFHNKNVAKDITSENAVPHEIMEKSETDSTSIMDNPKVRGSKPHIE